MSDLRAYSELKILDYVSAGYTNSGTKAYLSATRRVARHHYFPE